MNYLSADTSGHSFGCMLEALPGVHPVTKQAHNWQSEPIFYVDSMNPEHNRSIALDPDPRFDNEKTRPLVYSSNNGVKIPVDNNTPMKMAGKFNAYTTQESGHITLSIMMVKDKHDVKPRPLHKELSTSKSGPWVGRTSSTVSKMGTSRLHDELRKRYSGMQAQSSLSISSIYLLPDGNYIAASIDKGIYYSSSSTHWVGPIPKDENGLIHIPLSNGEVYIVNNDRDGRADAIEKFEHVGQFYSNDNYLYDDAHLRTYGTIEECAQRCLVTDGCKKFTYAYEALGERGRYCTLFSQNINELKTKNDYQMYELLEE